MVPVAALLLPPMLATALPAAVVAVIAAVADESPVPYVPL